MHQDKEEHEGWERKWEREGEGELGVGPGSRERGGQGESDEWVLVVWGELVDCASPSSFSIFSPLLHSFRTSASDLPLLFYSFIQIDKRGLPIPTSPSGSLLSSSGLKNLMMRRGSSYSTNTIHSTLAPSAHTTTSDDHPNTLTPTTTTTTNTEPFSPSPAPGGAGAMQPDPEKDSGDEVKFTVELTRIMNLPGLYSIDLKRQKGPLWTYAWIYQRLFEAVEEKKMLAAAAA
jgi:hypothetical protein